MRNYVETCKDICGYNLVYNFFYFFAIKKFTFCGALFKRILAWVRGTDKKIVPVIVTSHLT